MATTLYLNKNLLNSYTRKIQDLEDYKIASDAHRAGVSIDKYKEMMGIVDVNQQLEDKQIEEIFLAMRLKVLDAG